MSIFNYVKISNVILILLLTSLISCVSHEKDAASSSDDSSSSAGVSQNAEKKVFVQSQALMLIPSQEVDLTAVYEKYPNLVSISIEGRHGGGSYSLEELKSKNFLVNATGPHMAGHYVVQVEVPSVNSGGFNRIQFSY